MNQTESNILIIGGGIAGVAAAISLKRAGIPCRVFEAYDELTNIGGALQLFPNGMKILKEFGLEDEAIAKAALLTEVQYKNHLGSSIVRSPIGTVDQYDHSTVTIRRSVLHKMLIDECERLGVFIEYGKKLCCIEESSQQVKLKFTDDTSAIGKYVIGADGIHSFVRSYILPDCTGGQYSNLIGFSGFVPSKDLDPSLLPGTMMEITIGPIGFFGYSFADNMNIPNSDVFWWCFLEQKNKPSKEELAAMSEETVQKMLLDAHKNWRQPIEALVLKTKKTIRVSLSDILNLNSWHKGRAVIIGDAAHAMNPISGQGACSSLEDAIMLAKLLQKNPEQYDEVFARFEAERKPRVNQITGKARKSSQRIMINVGRIGYWVRNKVFAVLVRLSSKRWSDWVFKYDINKLG